MNKIEIVTLCIVCLLVGGFIGWAIGDITATDDILDQVGDMEVIDEWTSYDIFQRLIEIESHAGFQPYEWEEWMSGEIKFQAHMIMDTLLSLDTVREIIIEED